MTHLAAELPRPRLSLVEGSGLAYYTDERLFKNAGIRIALTTRLGGVSETPYEGLNLGSHVGDSLAAVQSNRMMLLRELGFAETDEEIATGLVVPNQVHGSNIECISQGESMEAFRSAAADGADALIVNRPGVAAMLCYADCMPVIIASPCECVAVVHAGWRGVMAEIASLAVTRIVEMHPEVSADQLNVYIGPYIHAECFEVSKEIRGAFADKFGEAVTEGDRHVDLGKAQRVSLSEAGIAPERIADVGKCTVCNVDAFYSYRAEKGTCGRHAAIGFVGQKGTAPLCL